MNFAAPVVGRVLAACAAPRASAAVLPGDSAASAISGVEGRGAANAAAFAQALDNVAPPTAPKPPHTDVVTR